jgi:hypothetical protein
MSYRRGIFIKNAAKFLDISEESIIVINMEKGIFKGIKNHPPNPIRIKAIKVPITA